MDKTPANSNITLYSLLDISNTATTEEIKKAYRKIALLVHPDKNQNDPDAAEKFRNLNQAYRILSDPEKRKVYDDTGEYEENEVGNINDTYEYFREIYPRIKVEDIDSFEKNYKGSLIEREDLIEFYEEKEGDLTQLLSYIPLSGNKDIKRFLKIYKRLIEEGEIEEYDNYIETRNDIELVKEENKNDTAEAEKSLNDLKQQIMKNCQKRSNFNTYLSKLGIIEIVNYFIANKYGDPKDINNEPQIDDDEFMRIQNNIKKKKKKKIN